MNVVSLLVEEASGICPPWDGSNKVHSLSGTSGTFFSPDYPVPYQKDVRCIWTISVPSDKRVKLTFEDFYLERPFYSCNRQSTSKIDYVEIDNGQDPESNEFAFYCGNKYKNFSSGSHPDEIYSTGRDMWIKFYSNSPQSWKTDRGFKARYETVDICKYYL